MSDELPVTGMRRRFIGRTVVVTGAGSGIGRAMADGFRAEGATVVAVDLRADRLDWFAGDDGVATVAADVTDPDIARQVVAEAGDRLDVLCSNAGIIDRLAPIDETTEAEWDRLLAVNLTGTFLWCRAAAQRMLRQGGGAIVTTASVAGLRGGRAGAAYTASKWGVVGLTQNMAATLGSSGIRANAICPGGTATAITEGVDLDPRGIELLSRDRMRPPGATPAQVAAVALFLASDDASHVNGAVIPVDNGTVAY